MARTLQLGPRPESPRLAVAPAPRTGPPMFLYGIGAAKCGTTWLYDYLRAHPDCHLRGHKELHYFDNIENMRHKAESERLAELIETREYKLAGLDPAKKVKELADLLDMRDFRRVLETCVQDKNAYFRYMMTGLHKQKLVADITPNYAFVSAEMLGKMLGTATETRFLYIIRDPVARFWSHVRMDARKTGATGEKYLAEVRAVLNRVARGEEMSILSHSNYVSTLSKLEAAIPEDRRMVMFYEDLMTTSGLRALCKFLRIKPLMTGFERQSNVGNAADMTEDELAMVRRVMQPQYEAVASRFPVLPKAWQKSMAMGFA